MNIPVQSIEKEKEFTKGITEKYEKQLALSRKMQARGDELEQKLEEMYRQQKKRREELKAELKTQKRHVLAKDRADEMVRTEHKRGKLVKSKLIQDLKMQLDNLNSESDKLKVKIVGERKEEKNKRIAMKERIHDTEAKLRASQIEALEISERSVNALQRIKQDMETLKAKKISESE